jgi:hypothetical protein
MNKNTTLRSLGSYKGFFLGQLEGQFIRKMANTFSAERADDVISALNSFEFTKRIKDNYKFIKDNKDNAVLIANYLCAVNWMSWFYNQFSDKDDPRVIEILKSFHLDNELDYFQEAADYYNFAYDYLYSKFYRDSTIADSVKTDVYRLND